MSPQLSTGLHLKSEEMRYQRNADALAMLGAAVPQSVPYTGYTVSESSPNTGKHPSQQFPAF